MIGEGIGDFKHYFFFLCLGFLLSGCLEYKQEATLKVLDETIQLPDEDGVFRVVGSGPASIQVLFEPEGKTPGGTFRLSRGKQTVVYSFTPDAVIAYGDHSISLMIPAQGDRLALKWDYRSVVSRIKDTLYTRSCTYSSLTCYPARVCVGQEQIRRTHWSYRTEANGAFLDSDMDLKAMLISEPTEKVKITETSLGPCR